MVDSGFVNTSQKNLQEASVCNALKNIVFTHITTRHLSAILSIDKETLPAQLKWKKRKDDFGWSE